MKNAIFLVLVLVNVLNAEEQVKPGGWTNADVNDKSIKEVALNCSRQWNEKKSGFNNFYKVSKIESAKTQVVAGINYELNVTLAETECAKSDVLSKLKAEENLNLLQSHVDACGVKANGSKLVCKFTYWAKAWENKYELTDVTCFDEKKQQRLSTSLLGNHAMSSLTVQISLYSIVLTFISMFFIL